MIWAINTKEWFKSLILNLFLTFGVLWTITEILSNFSENTGNWISSRWWLFVIIGLIVAVARSWPKKGVTYKIAGKDTSIELRVGDAFKMKGCIVVPSNSRFSNSLSGAISRASSMHGKLVRDVCGNDTQMLDDKIARSLGQQNVKPAVTESGSEYSIGTVAGVRLGENLSLFYILALTHVSQSGKCECTIDEFQEALVKLWIHISDWGEKGDVVIPLIGTGHGRINMTRDIVIKNIVKTYIASCATKVYCDKLTIAIHPPDVKRCQLNLEELEQFIKHECANASYNYNGRTIGQEQE